jgi:hypothetical protein
MILLMSYDIVDIVDEVGNANNDNNRSIHGKIVLFIII